MEQANAGKQTTPWKKVIQKQLSRSTMPLIPQMVKRQSKLRRALNMIVFLGCACGFIYQVYCYSSHFLTHPTTIDIEMKYSKNPEFPVITICNRNSIRRTMFCHDNPRQCRVRGWNTRTNSIVKYCTSQPDCINITVPNLNVSDDRNLVAKYGHQFTSWGSNCFESRFKKQRRCRDEDVTRLQYRSIYGEYRNCFRIDLKNNRKYEDAKFSDMFLLPVRVFIVAFNIEESEYSYPHNLVGAHFCLHSRHDVINPFLDGFFLKVGKAYRINLSVKEKNLLPWPYSSNCFDYDKFSEGKDNYYSYSSCYYDCMLNTSIELCGHASSYYPFQHNFTDKPIINVKNCCSETPDLYSECFSRCRQPCRATEYVIDGMKEDEPSSLLGENVIHDKGFSYLFITFKSQFITTYSYQPKYQTVEFLAMIGGYIGIWLGMSLLTIVDFVETVSVIFCSVLCKKRNINTNNEQ